MPTPQPPEIQKPSSCSGHIEREAHRTDVRKNALWISVKLGCAGLLREESANTMFTAVYQEFVPTNQYDAERMRQIGEVASARIATICDVCPLFTPDDGAREQLPEADTPDNVTALRKASGEA